MEKLKSNEGSLSNFNVPYQHNVSKSLESFETSLRSLENALIFNKKKYSEYKNDKIFELEKECSHCMSVLEFEKAIILLKKLLFFDPNSIIFIFT